MSEYVMNKARKLAENGDVTKIPTRNAREDLHRVNSSTGTNHYTVRTVKGKRVCNCEGFTNYYRRRNKRMIDGKMAPATCSHIEAVKIYKEMNGGQD